MSLPQWLEKKGIVAIEGVDTRLVTKAIRTEGCLRCVVSTTDSDRASLVAKARAMPATDGRDLATEVSTVKPFDWDEAYDPSYPALIESSQRNERRLRCVALDFGAKRNILRSLVHCGFDVTVVPASSTAADVLAHDPEAIFLSNGPGDPRGGEPGHRHGRRPDRQAPDLRHLPGPPDPRRSSRREDPQDALRPPRREPSGARPAHRRVEITSQNHSFAVDPEALPPTSS
jgi:carbamoyl-phosphate synthase small subunit